MRVEALDLFWTDKGRYDLAEKRFYEVVLKVTPLEVSHHYSPLVSEIAKAREHIQTSLEKVKIDVTNDTSRSEVLDRILLLENENADLRSKFVKLLQEHSDVLKRLQAVENRLSISNGNVKEDDDVDLFASDSEEETQETVRIREERLAAYKAKKSTKAIIIAKSSLILDVKPWDDETDLGAMEVEIRKITLEGLLWGASRLVPVAFGIKKLSISCVVEDDKVSIDWLTEEIEKLEDFVQSVDIAAFNKI
ncbi:probable elongation factor 1-delta isoform X1 [Drosophila subobscura]|uniref:probable elongation factor 1-delta isoform X1 n=1 Tax=Drosophila subobscura TaxID=7241 RepID=UPI00155A8C81|nr:probable elongation factor 1-delta isoform X1 [Drosophila subobscura]